MLLQRYLNVAQLRELLVGMEHDLGLGDISQNEKDVFYAVVSVIEANSNREGVAKSDDIKSHLLVQGMTQPTFHRSLKSLLDMGLIERAANTKAGSYVATSLKLDQTA